MNENFHLDSKCKINGQAEAEELIDSLKPVFETVVMYNVPYALGRLPPWPAMVIQLFLLKFSKRISQFSHDIRK